ncbi:hypothetical protein EUTSA_v10012323mg [Eutrema salsugineum]|uniref:Replication protein A 70 kDa DNA-binding subunit B/D first OB fold domain-containing protein n=1 Tax=Eutrema salsugineum TaxID=72664 RepID=V4KM84_EUTSA|nr:hypothetical protein EUTSA_v10012323mg [Eutrema salsugineum]
MSIFKRKSSISVLIRELNPISDSYVINVKVLKIWDGFKGKGGSSLEMVLVDREGDRIHASVDKEFVKTFRKDLVEGQAISINTFKVVDYNNIIGQIIRVGHVENVVAQGKRRFRLKVSLRDTRLPNDRFILTPVEEEASKDSDEAPISLSSSIEESESSPISPATPVSKRTNADISGGSNSSSRPTRKGKKIIMLIV